MMRRTLAALSLVYVVTASAEQLAVRVLDRATDAPLANAYVQIGPAPGVPFEGNWGFTDGGGWIVLEHPALVEGLPLTAAPAGYARLTVLSCPLGSLTVWCDPSVRPAWPDTSLVTGVVRGLPIVSNDGNLDLGVVMGAVGSEAFLGGGMGMLMSAVMDTMHIGPPVNADVPIPENIDIPNQIELFFVTFFKEPYTQRLPTGRTVDIVCLGYRVNVWDLIAGQPQQIVATKATARRDYLVTGDAVVNHTCTVSFVHGVQVRVNGLPAGSTGYVASLGELTASPRRERFVPLHGVRCRAGVDTTVSLSYLPATVPFSDLVAYAGVAYVDTSAEPTWGGGAFDWEGLSPGATRVFDAFYAPPSLARTGDVFSFGGFEGPATPPADWVSSSFWLDDRSAADLDSLVWEVVGPASWAAFEVPLLDGAAPGWNQLPDPAATPLDDRLVWTCAVLWAPGVSLQGLLASPFVGARLFSYRTVEAPPLEAPSWVHVAIPGPADLLVTWAPVPLAEAYLVRWRPTPWGSVLGSAVTPATSYLDPGALPVAGSQRYYTVASRAGASESLPSAVVGGCSWELDDGQ